MLWAGISIACKVQLLESAPEFDFLLVLAKLIVYQLKNILEFELSCIYESYLLTFGSVNYVRNFHEDVISLV